MYKIRVFLVAILVFFTACSMSKENIQPKYDGSLPRIVGLKGISDINSIALEWRPTNEYVDGYFIYRTTGNSPQLELVTEIKDKFISHYVDKDLQSDTAYKYQIASYLRDKESYSSEPLIIKTLKPLESVSFLKAIENMPRKVKLIWRPHDNPRVQSYIIERRAIGTTKWEDVTKLEGRLQVEYIDSNLKDNTSYEYRMKVETFDKIISLPSEIARSRTKDTLPMVQNVRATLDRPNKIQLSWEAVPMGDVHHYNVYRSNFEAMGFDIVKKTNATTFTDEINDVGAVRYYRVSAVDGDDLEGSIASTPIKGSTLPPPSPPTIMNNIVNYSEVSIAWVSTTPRAKKYIVTKKEAGWDGKSFDFVNIEATSFTDKDIIPGKEYIYTVKAIDEYGLVSEPSLELQFVVPKGN